MCGTGLNGGGTDIAHLHLQALLDYAKCKGVAIAMLVADISSAFAIMSRDIVFQESQDDPGFFNKCEDRGVDRNVALQFSSYLHEIGNVLVPVWCPQSM